MGSFPVQFPLCVSEIPALRQRKALLLVPSTADFSCGRPAECKPPQGHPLTWQLPSPVCSPRWLMLSSRPLCCLLSTPSRLQTVCWARNSQQHTMVHAVLTPKLKFPDGSSSSFFWPEGLAPWWLKCTQSFFSMHLKSFDNFHSPAAPVSMSGLPAVNDKKQHSAYAPRSVPLCSHDAYLKTIITF